MPNKSAPEARKERTMGRRTKVTAAPRREGREEYVRSGKPVTIDSDPAAQADNPPAPDGDALAPGDPATGGETPQA